MKLNTNLIGILLALQIIALPTVCFSQYFQRLYDVDSAQEWGWDIFLRQDSNYFISGWTYNQFTGKFSLFNLSINSISNNIVNSSIIMPDSPSISIGPGLPGEVKKTSEGYLIPITVQWPNPTTGYLYSAGGILKLNSAGDTILKRVYSDTSNFFDLINTCAVLNNGTLIVGGSRSLNTTSSYHPYVLIHTNSLGDTIWTKTFQKDSTQSSAINSIVPLADGRIVLGATSTYKEYTTGFGSFSHNSPWFIVVDSMGNKLKDTVFGSQYMIGRNGICGELYKDVVDGYIVIGNFDSLFTSDPTEPQNYPGYVAHLDTNFRITWLTELPYTAEDGHRQGVLVRQLRDSSLLVIGDSWDMTGYDKGFAAKISRTGEIIWSHNYISEALQNAYLRDGIEKSDGSLVFTGQSSNDTLPVWHQHFDMWLLGVDSNGCEMLNCGITNIIPEPEKRQISFSVYPNPTNGMFTMTASEAGKLTLFSIHGKLVISYSINVGKSDIQLPIGLAAGFYTVRFIPESGGVPKEVRLVYHP